MLIVPRASVRVNLTIAILLTVALSWVISGGVANYFNYLSFRSLRAEMMKHPDVYARPIPEPKFGVVEFFTGKPPFARGPRGPQPRPPAMDQPQGAGAPPVGQPDRPSGPVDRPNDRPHGPEPGIFEARSLLLRAGVALALAALAGAWLGRKFTTPLSHLAKGADAFQAGEFGYRIPARGTNEFAAVANAMNEMARQVSDQISRLEDDAQRRRQFLADIAHELRSPVTTMETMAGALKDGLAEEPERRDFAVSAIATTSQRLRRLVQDLMELAKLDLTELPLNMVDVDLRELLVSALQAHESAAAAAGIALMPMVAAGPVSAVGDPDRMAQVFDNIIENAISYAGEGAQVKVSISDCDPIRVTIADTGRGIRAEDVPYVLDPFYRADAARTPNDCHSGLGLSIASRLIQAHGGGLTVTSEQGTGTTVTITLPKRHHSAQ